jgi:hypothetical protein
VAPTHARIGSSSDTVIQDLERAAVHIGAILRCMPTARRAEAVKRLSFDRPGLGEKQQGLSDLLPATAQSSLREVLQANPAKLSASACNRASRRPRSDIAWMAPSTRSRTSEIAI